MIDWFNLITNALWILGISVALAVLSYASWAATARNLKFFGLSRSSSYPLFLSLAGLLFSLGMAGASDSIFEEAAWIGFCLVFIVCGGIWMFRRKTG